MTHQALLTAIYTKLSTSNDLPPIAYPNVNFDAKNKTEWLEVYVMPLPTKELAFGGSSDKAGLIQINCIVKANVGEIAAAKLADKVLALFPIKSEISSGLYVDLFPYASSGVLSDNVYELPVTIQYRLLDK